MKRLKLPLHVICTALGAKLTRCLPALPALTGCGTTSKISTKLAALKAIHKNLTLIHNFNRSALAESMMQMAETFLVKCFKPTTNLETFGLLSLMALPSKWTSRGPHSPGSMQCTLSTTGVDTSPFRDATLKMNTDL